MTHAIRQNSQIQVNEMLRYERSLNEQILELLEASARMIDVQYGAISFLHNDHQYFTCTYQFELDQLPLEQALCRYVIDRQETIEITNGKEHQKILSMQGDSFRVQYYLGFPLKSFESQQVVGSLCLFDPDKKKVRNEVKVVLQAIASASAALIEVHIQREKALSSLNTNTTDDELVNQNNTFIHEANNALNLSSCIFYSILKKVKKQNFNLYDIYESVSRARFALEKIVLKDDSRDITKSIVHQTRQIIETITSGTDEQNLEIQTITLIERETSAEIKDITYYQIISNLLMNAIEATKNNEVKKIEVLLTRSQNNLYISVKDNGKGIKEEDQTKIFKQIYTTKINTKYSGRGLKMISELVESHQGKISFKSHLYKGTQFVIELPILARQSETKEQEWPK